MIILPVVVVAVTWCFRVVVVVAAVVAVLLVVVVVAVEVVVDVAVVVGCNSWGSVCNGFSDCKWLQRLFVVVGIARVALTAWVAVKAAASAAIGWLQLYRSRGRDLLEYSQMTPTSSLWPQLCTCQPGVRQPASELSVP